MPRNRDGHEGKPKPEMIREVLEEKPDLPTRRVQAAVWERYGGEVTPREVAQVRRKLRQEQAPPPEEAPAAEAVAPAARPPRKRAARTKQPPRRRRSAPAEDAAAAEVTVRQLSAILEAAGEAGGLRRLREAVRTVLLVRERVGDVDDRQLAAALDFLDQVTGRKR
jgi:hypothetical protein